MVSDPTTTMDTTMTNTSSTSGGVFVGCETVTMDQCFSFKIYIVHASYSSGILFPTLKMARELKVSDTINGKWEEARLAGEGTG